MGVNVVRRSLSLRWTAADPFAILLWSMEQALLEDTQA